MPVAGRYWCSAQHHLHRVTDILSKELRERASTSVYVTDIILAMIAVVDLMRIPIARNIVCF